MARAKTQTFGQFQILLGDGEDPEVFSIICGLTSKGMQRVASTNTTVELDCDDEDKPGYEAEDVASFKCTISGSGVWAAQNHNTMLTWFRSGLPRNVKVRNMGVNVGDIEYEQAPAVLTTLSQNGEKGGKILAEIAIAFREMPATTLKAA